MTVRDLLAAIERAAPFIAGITASGGEPTNQLSFITALFAAVKSHPSLHHLTTFLDTNGALDPSLWDLLLPFTDGVMVDLKSFHRERHVSMTGVELDCVRAGMERIHASGKLYEIRVLLVPGFNDDPAELAAMGKYLMEFVADSRVRILAYHSRSAAPCAPYALSASPEAVTMARNILGRYGLKVFS